MSRTQSEITLSLPRVSHQRAEVDSLRIFYRELEAPEGARTMLLLHAFPPGSHQFVAVVSAHPGHQDSVAQQIEELVATTRGEPENVSDDVLRVHGGLVAALPSQVARDRERALEER